MGNFEKLVVLTVIFLSIIVLAVSLNGGDDEAKQKQGPLAAAQDRLGVEQATGAPLLSSEVGAEASQPEEERGSADDGRTSPAVGESAGGRVRVLVDGPGLIPSAFPDYMEYEAAAGDTWALLAKRFYRDEREVELLMSANEEMTVPVAGARLLVPVFDLSLAGAGRASLLPSPAPSGATAIDGGAPAGSADLATLSEYVVMNGDNLSKISKKVYGTANRWQEIYKANQGVLEGPDWLQVGMKLKIPR
jgi:nucleoid-associated protein YgaU